MSLTDLFDHHPELEFHGVVVLHRGATLLERTWSPYRPDDLTLVYSVSKTFTATAVGLAIAEGRFALTDRVVTLLPDDVPADVDERTSQLTVHHLLSMSTGHDVDTVGAIDGVGESDWARRILSVVPATPVGSRHVYNNGASFLLGELVRQHTGLDILEYLRPRLFEPLGIAATWDRDGLGRCFGWSGLHLTTAGLAAMGELYRCDGVWKGVRLLPEGWVQTATTAQIPTAPDDQPEWRLGYGYQLWLGREGYRLDGAFGQYAIVLPERELVIGITSSQEHTQRVMDFVFDELLPALPDRPEVLPDGALWTPDDTGLVASWSATEAGFDPELAIEPDAEQLNLPTLVDLSAHAEPEDGEAGPRFQLRFAVGGDTVELSAQPGGWTRQQLRLAGVDVPVAVAAGTQPDGSLLALVLFTDSPHTLRLRLAGDGTAGLAWRNSPLHAGSLAGLRAAAMPDQALAT